MVLPVPMVHSWSTLILLGSLCVTTLRKLRTKVDQGGPGGPWGPWSWVLDQKHCGLAFTFCWCLAWFIQALTLPPQIYPSLPFAHELFCYGFLPHGSIILSNSPNAPLPPLIQTSLFTLSYSHTLHASEHPKCIFSRSSPAFPNPRLFLLFLLTITPSPNSTSILSSRMHCLSEWYLSVLNFGRSIRWWCMSLSTPRLSAQL